MNLRWRVGTSGKFSRMIDVLFRAWKLMLSRIFWGLRFHFLGARTVIGKCRLVRNPASISINHHVTLGDGWTLADLTPTAKQDKPKIRIGAYCNIRHDFQCNANVSVEIQDHVLIAPRVFITDSDHVVSETQRTTLGEDFQSAPVVIEHDCWLGVNSVILKGVRIGHHSIIGANAVVTRSVPPFSTVVGVPGKIVKQKSAVTGNLQ